MKRSEMIASAKEIFILFEKRHDVEWVKISKKDAQRLQAMDQNKTEIKFQYRHAGSVLYIERPYGIGAIVNKYPSCEDEVLGD